ncbi:MAG: hypothetical protein PHO56_03605 [Patescibacteria group bacterium]|nr:hypothetical protein [Patescibacteria group bacterium]
MLSLNLTAEEAKQKLKFQRLYLLLVKTELSLLILLLLTGIIIFTAEKMLANNILKSGQETAKLISATSAEYTAKAASLNDKITAVSQIENGFIPYSMILRDLIALMPESVSLSYLNINSKTKAIKIRGLAPTRENLLDLEKILKETPWLTKVNIPFGEKLQKNNINFDIDLEFDPAKMPS